MDSHFALHCTSVIPSHIWNVGCSCSSTSSGGSAKKHLFDLKQLVKAWLAPLLSPSTTMSLEDVPTSQLMHDMAAPFTVMDPVHASLFVFSTASLTVWLKHFSKTMSPLLWSADSTSTWYPLLVFVKTVRYPSFESEKKKVKDVSQYEYENYCISIKQFKKENNSMGRTFGSGDDFNADVIFIIETLLSTDKTNLGVVTIVRRFCRRTVGKQQQLKYKHKWVYRHGGVRGRLWWRHHISMLEAG